MIDWKQVDTVLLDMDGTLLDLHFDNYFWQDYLPSAVAQKNAVSREQANKELFTQYDEIRGTLNWYSLDYWGRQLDLDILSLKKEIVHMIGLRAGVEQFLHFLGQQGKERILVTNAHPKSLKLKMDVTGLDKLLDRTISSHDFGFPKEDQGFWSGLSRELGFDPDRTLFIDDTPVILDSAARFGVAHLWAIECPDSKAPPKLPGTYPLLGAFSDLVGKEG